MLINIKELVNNKTDWNSYKKYTPYNVMKIFKDVFLPQEGFLENENNVNI